MQQLLPFTVLKLLAFRFKYHDHHKLVATALTVYGIETNSSFSFQFESERVATALTVYGIETYIGQLCGFPTTVATALTVYGIETRNFYFVLLDEQNQLQQLLPFTVLKLSLNHNSKFQ